MYLSPWKNPLKFQYTRISTMPLGWRTLNLQTCVNWTYKISRGVIMQRCIVSILKSIYSYFVRRFFFFTRLSEWLKLNLLKIKLKVQSEDDQDFHQRLSLPQGFTQITCVSSSYSPFIYLLCFIFFTLRFWQFRRGFTKYPKECPQSVCLECVMST